MTDKEKQEIVKLIDTRVATVNSPYATAGSYNITNSMLKIDAEIIKIFMDLPFERQAKVVDFMLKQSKKAKKKRYSHG